jgi:hypothetical protein
MTTAGSGWRAGRGGGGGTLTVCDRGADVELGAEHGYQGGGGDSGRADHKQMDHQLIVTGAKPPNKIAREPCRSAVVRPHALMSAEQEHLG